MILTFPNVIFRWHNAKRGICGIEDYITDFEKLRYGYELKEGQVIYLISYDDVIGRALTIYHAEIVEINDKGIVIDGWLSQWWDTDDAAAHGFTREDFKAFLPWKYKGANLQLQPCESFFENYKAKDLVNHTARLNNDVIIGDKVKRDPKGSGIFYQHGGWRTNTSKYKENIDHIVKVGQLELSFE